MGSLSDLGCEILGVRTVVRTQQTVLGNILFCTIQARRGESPRYQLRKGDASQGSQAQLLRNTCRARPGVQDPDLGPI